MKKDRIEEGRFTDHGHGLGTVTEEMVRQRARELALINGRNEDQVLSSDIEEARRELTGAERLVPEPTAAERIPEEERWDPNPGTTGQKVPPVAAPDEQTFAEKLVEEGVDEAEQDQMVQASREGRKRSMRPSGPAKPRS
jgi:hypothetical protein